MPTTLCKCYCTMNTSYPEKISPVYFPSFTVFYLTNTLPCYIEWKLNIISTKMELMLHELISWIDHVRTVKNKIAKYIGLLYCVSQFFNEDSLKIVYFLYTRSYLNYANIAWTSAYATKLKRVCLKQKHAIRIVFNKDKLTHSKPLFEHLNVLNVYQINIYQHLNFMHKFINNQIPSIFSDLIKRPDHKYPTNFSQSSFY